jgi:hypothetical protein
MAIKIVQPVGILTTNVSTSSTCRAISLKTGYIRVSTGYTGSFVAIGTEPVATKDSFYIPPYTTEIIKENFKKQGIAGITTGTTTTITFDQNLYGSFEVGDYVTIENASPAGINTVHVPVIAVSNSGVELQYNSSSVTGVSVNGSSTLTRSVKVAALGHVTGGEISITEVVQLVTE